MSLAPCRPTTGRRLRPPPPRGAGPRPPIALALLLALCTLALLPTPAAAGGLFLTDRGARPLSRGFAFVAGVDSPDAVWYNPANLTYSGQQFLFDATVGFFRGTFTRIDSGGNVLPTASFSAPSLPIPMLAYSHPIRERWTIGLGVHAPNAALLSWPRGVTAAGVECEGPGQPGCEHAPQRYSLLSLEGSLFGMITPALAYQVVDGLSIGLGMNLLIGSFAGETAISSCDGFVCTQPENPDWDGVTRFNLSPIFEPGITGGITYDAGVVRIGASFVWWPKAVRGDATLDVRLPSAAIFDGATVEGNQARVELDVPAMIRLGVELRPKNFLRIEAAVVLERWSTQDAARVIAKDVWIRNARAIGDYQIGTITIPRHMNDVWSIRLGGEVGLLDNKLWLRAGANYENSSFDDQYLSPLTLDTSKLIVGLGASYEITTGFIVDVSYGHVFMEDRAVRDSRVPQPNPIRPPRDAMNAPTAGGPAYVGNGNYIMEMDMVGIGMRYVWDSGPSSASEVDAESNSDVEPESDNDTRPDSDSSVETESDANSDSPVDSDADDSGSEVETDSDNDGVPDDRDRCGFTEANVFVDERGCPDDAIW